MNPELVDDNQKVEAEGILDLLEMDSDSLDNHLSNFSNNNEASSGENLEAPLSFISNVIEAMEHNVEMDEPVNDAALTLSEVDEMTSSNTVPDICIIRKIDDEKSTSSTPSSTISLPPPSKSTTTGMDVMKNEISEITMPTGMAVTSSPSCNAPSDTPAAPSLGACVTPKSNGAVVSSPSCNAPSDTPAASSLGACVTPESNGAVVSSPSSIAPSDTPAASSLGVCVTPKSNGTVVSSPSCIAPSYTPAASSLSACVTPTSNGTVVSSPSSMDHSDTPAASSVRASVTRKRSGIVGKPPSSITNSDTPAPSSLQSTVTPPLSRTGASEATTAKSPVNAAGAESTSNCQTSSKRKRKNQGQKVPRRYRGLSEEEAEAVRIRTNQMEKKRMGRNNDALKILESILPDCLIEKDKQMTQFSVLKTTTAYTFLLSVCKTFNASMDGDAFKYGLRMIQDCQKVRWQLHLINTSVYDHLFENENGSFFRTLKHGIIYDACSLMVKSGAKHASHLLRAFQAEAATFAPQHNNRLVSKYTPQATAQSSLCNPQQNIVRPSVPACLPQTPVQGLGFPFLRPQVTGHGVPGWPQIPHIGSQFALPSMALGNTPGGLYYVPMQPAPRFVPLIAPRFSTSYAWNQLMQPAHRFRPLLAPQFSASYGVGEPGHIQSSMAQTPPDVVTLQNASVGLSLVPGMALVNSPTLPATASAGNLPSRRDSGLGSDLDSPNISPADLILYH